MSDISRVFDGHLKPQRTRCKAGNMSVIKNISNVNQHPHATKSWGVFAPEVFTSFKTNSGSFSPSDVNCMSGRGKNGRWRVGGIVYGVNVIRPRSSRLPTAANVSQMPFHRQVYSKQKNKQCWIVLSISTCATFESFFQKYSIILLR